MLPSDPDLYEPPLFRRVAWPQLAALAAIGLAVLVPLLLAVALAS